eukprot:XP_001708951.1 Hypothetical protein GL50803_39450 [Giardia lamblia ATCC 50803]
MIFNRLLKCIDTYSTGCVTECHVFSDDLCVCSLGRYHYYIQLDASSFIHSLLYHVYRR